MTDNSHIGSTFHAKQFDTLEVIPIAYTFYCPKCEADRVHAGQIKKEITCHICNVVYSELKLKDLPDARKKRNEENGEIDKASGNQEDGNSEAPSQTASRSGEAETGRQPSS